MNGFVEGHPISMLVDTGSSVTLLHKEVWDNVLCRQNGLVPSTVPIMAVNGEHLAVSGELLQVGPHQMKHKVLVVDDMSQQFILGTDYLEQQHCVINLITGTLTVGMDSHCVPCIVFQQTAICLPCHCGGDNSHPRLPPGETTCKAVSTYSHSSWNI